VSVLKIKKGDLPLRLPISATADVWEKTTIKAEVGGVVEKIHCSIGQHVKKNSLLLKIDDSELQLEVDIAQAAMLQGLSTYKVNESLGQQEEKKLSDKEKKELHTLKTKFEKAKKDFENDKISSDKMDKITEEYREAQVYLGVLRDEIRKAQDGYSNANLRLKQSKLNLRRSFIKSPFPSTISDIMVSPGENLTIGMDILKIVNLQSIYLKGYALESELHHLKKNIAVRIKFDSFPDKIFYGQIRSISPEIDPENKTITIYVNLDNKDNMILPGMHAEIDVEHKVFKDVIKVPRVAILVRQERPLVFVVKDKIAIWTYVELGEKNDEDQVVTSGLVPGDIVVTDGHMTLGHQSKVKIIKSSEQK
ncbi:MAG: efflux RND transporter periplasmic adaptor subunit, partial [bacterium]|nr:efflux RND transporter periplasmic adaptor subunit [bacterium]